MTVMNVALEKGRIAFEHLDVMREGEHPTSWSRESTFFSELMKCSYRTLYVSSSRRGPLYLPLSISCFTYSSSNIAEPSSSCSNDNSCAERAGACREFENESYRLSWKNEGRPEEEGSTWEISSMYMKQKPTSESFAPWLNGVWWSPKTWLLISYRWEEEALNSTMVNWSTRWFRYCASHNLISAPYN